MVALSLINDKRSLFALLLRATMDITLDPLKSIYL